MLNLTHLSAATLISLLVAAALAGWVDAVAGGGGLIQLPALLLGLPKTVPATVLGTNKLSSVMGTTAATATYLRRPEARPHLRTAFTMAGAAFIGSALGAHAASAVPAQVFRPLVVALLCLVGLWTWRRPALGESANLRWQPGPRMYTVVAVIGLVIGFYDGIFGPGTGSFLVFLLVSVVGFSFLRASATAKVVNLSTNVGAIIVFGAGGHLLVPLGIAMGACNVFGGLVGARMAVARGSGFVRKVFLTVVVVLIARLGWQTLH